MRRILILLACFAGAFIIGIGTVLLTYDNAAAVYCDVWTAPYYVHTDIPCTTPSGKHGTWILKCNGWLMGPDGGWYECACSYYQCYIPPKPPDDIPYQEP